jgi:hypothetical protein
MSLWTGAADRDVTLSRIRIPRQATAVLIAADFDTCVETQCARRSGPLLPPSRYFPTVVRCYQSFARLGSDGLALRKFLRLSDRRRVPFTRCRACRWRACNPAFRWRASRPGIAQATEHNGGDGRRGATRSHAQRTSLREHGDDGEHRTFRSEHRGTLTTRRRCAPPDTQIEAQRLRQ